ncbi:MAG: Mpo1-like protein [Acidobacteriota bacterium]
MSAIADYFADYGSHHLTAGNKLFHRMGIPMIMLTLLGMLTRVMLYSSAGAGGNVRIDAAIVLIVLSEIFYFTMEWRLGLAMLAVSVAFYFIGAAIPFWWNVALFVLGWIFQFIGHSVYEKKQPAFVRNLVHLLVGPLWILKGMVSRR